MNEKDKKSICLDRNRDQSLEKKIQNFSRNSKNMEINRKERNRVPLKIESGKDEKLIRNSRERESDSKILGKSKTFYSDFEILPSPDLTNKRKHSINIINKMRNYLPNKKNYFIFNISENRQNLKHKMNQNIKEFRKEELLINDPNQANFKVDWSKKQLNWQRPKTKINEKEYCRFLRKKNKNRFFKDLHDKNSTSNEKDNFFSNLKDFFFKLKSSFDESNSNVEKIRKTERRCFYLKLKMNLENIFRKLDEVEKSSYAKNGKSARILKINLKPLISLSEKMSAQRETIDEVDKHDVKEFDSKICCFLKLLNSNYFFYSFDKRSLLNLSRSLSEKCKIFIFNNQRQNYFSFQPKEKVFVKREKVINGSAHEYKIKNDYCHTKLQANNIPQDAANDNIYETQKFFYGKKLQNQKTNPMTILSPKIDSFSALKNNEVFFDHSFHYFKRKLNSYRNKKSESYKFNKFENFNKENQNETELREKYCDILAPNHPSNEKNKLVEENETTNNQFKSLEIELLKLKTNEKNLLAKDLEHKQTIHNLEKEITSQHQDYRLLIKILENDLVNINEKYYKLSQVINKKEENEKCKVDLENQLVEKNNRLKKLEQNEQKLILQIKNLKTKMRRNKRNFARRNGVNHQFYKTQSLQIRAPKIGFPQKSSSFDFNDKKPENNTQINPLSNQEYFKDIEIFIATLMNKNEIDKILFEKKIESLIKDNENLNIRCQKMSITNLQMNIIKKENSVLKERLIRLGDFKFVKKETEESIRTIENEEISLNDKKPRTKKKNDLVSSSKEVIENPEEDIISNENNTVKEDFERNDPLYLQNEKTNFSKYIDKTSKKEQNDLSWEDGFSNNHEIYEPLHISDDKQRSENQNHSFDLINKSLNSYEDVPTTGIKMSDSYRRDSQNLTNENILENRNKNSIEENSQINFGEKKDSDICISDSCSEKTDLVANEFKSLRKPIAEGEFFNLKIGVDQEKEFSENDEEDSHIDEVKVIKELSEFLWKDWDKVKELNKKIERKFERIAGKIFEKKYSEYSKKSKLLIFTILIKMKEKLLFLFNKNEENIKILENRKNKKKMSISKIEEISENLLIKQNKLKNHIQKLAQSFYEENEKLFNLEKEFEDKFENELSNEQKKIESEFFKLNKSNIENNLDELKNKIQNKTVLEYNDKEYLEKWNNYSKNIHEEIQTLDKALTFKFLQKQKIQNLFNIFNNRKLDE